MKRSINFLSILALICVLAFFQSCTHKPLAPWTPEAQKSGQVGIALSVHFDAFAAKKDPNQEINCDLNLINNQMKKQTLKVHEGKEVFFVALPEGTYHFESLSCGLLAKLRFTGTPALSLQGGKVYLLGILDVNLAEQNHFTWSLRTPDQKEYYALFENLPGVAKEQLRSPYTHRDLNLAMVNNTPGQIQYSIHGGKIPGQAEQLDLQRLGIESCVKEELQTNPLKVGKVSFYVVFQNGQMASLEKDISEHAYSDKFIQCVEEKIKNFRPNNNERFELTVTL